ncbi:Amino acid permease [Quillaja saponaria]|uniref:Amino acid permease n=1 Tax=Quillaja saponaria TaxID=32244 RepID=A0AAD7PPK3_QUISA|nr:Amino acid permease [Quillaja saponaria]
MGLESANDKTPLLVVEEAQPAERLPIKRTGTVWTAVAHIVTGVIGSGVLSLAWSIAQLGWIAGPLAMVIFASITLISAFLLCNTYRSPDPEYGPNRNRSYLDTVDFHLGEKYARVCSLFVYLSLYGLGIAYNVTSAISMRAIQKSNCNHKEGHKAACEYGDTYYMLLFGVVQTVLSQIPNFHNIEWLSVVAAIMSFTYSFIGMGLAIALVVEDGYVKGSIGGITTTATSEVAKVWLVAQALGDIAFAYPYSVILIEIQDTLKSPPPETQTMKKASIISVVISTLFYLCCGSSGYAAFGDDTPGNLLTGFGKYGPYWLVDIANLCIVFHLVGAYQVYSQPLFANVENWFHAKYSSSEFVNRIYTLKLPLLPAFTVNLLRLCFRTAYVASTVIIALIFPYFNQVLGALGGMTFWPLTIYFPVEMYFKQENIQAWTTKWVVLRTFTVVGLMVALFSLAGSIEGLIIERLS